MDSPIGYSWQYLGGMRVRSDPNYPFPGSVPSSVTGGVSDTGSGNSNGSGSYYYPVANDLGYDRACEFPKVASIGLQRTIVLCVGNHRPNSSNNSSSWDKSTKLYAVEYTNITQNGSQLDRAVQWEDASELVPWNDFVYPSEYDVKMLPNGLAIAVWLQSWKPTTAYSHRNENYFLVRIVNIYAGARVEHCRDYWQSITFQSE